MIVVVKFVALHRVLLPSIAAVVEEIKKETCTGYDVFEKEKSGFYQVNRERDQRYIHM